MLLLAQPPAAPGSSPRLLPCPGSGERALRLVDSESTVDTTAKKPEPLSWLPSGWRSSGGEGGSDELRPMRREEVPPACCGLSLKAWKGDPGAALTATGDADGDRRSDFRVVGPCASGHMDTTSAIGGWWCSPATCPGCSPRAWYLPWGEAPPLALPCSEPSNRPAVAIGLLAGELSPFLTEAAAAAPLPPAPSPAQVPRH